MILWSAFNSDSAPTVAARPRTSWRRPLSSTASQPTSRVPLSFFPSPRPSPRRQQRRSVHFAPSPVDSDPSVTTDLGADLGPDLGGDLGGDFVDSGFAPPSPLSSHGRRHAPTPPSLPPLPLGGPDFSEVMLDVTLRVTNILGEFEQVRNGGKRLWGNVWENVGKCGKVWENARNY